MVVVKLARIWQTGASIGRFAITLQFPIRLLCTVALIALWIYGMARFFRGIGWSRWFVLPYVLLFLCPMAWLIVHRIEPGGDFLALFLFQLPILIAVAASAKLHASIG
jgi:hypothetical protein